MSAAHHAQVRPAAIFWDMDGTLVDSEPLWQLATTEMGTRLGRTPTPEVVGRTTGGSFYSTLQILADHAGVTVTSEMAKEQRQLMFSRMEELMAAQLVTRPGVPELLADLQEHGIPMFLTTNTERQLVLSAIEAIGPHFFTDLICGDDVAAYKPAPDMFLEAARRAGASPADCLVFEDSLPGMTGALNAGCKVLALPEDPDLPLPEGAGSLWELQGHNTFSGVSSSTVFGWYSLFK